MWEIYPLPTHLRRRGAGFTLQVILEVLGVRQVGQDKGVETSSLPWGLRNRVRHSIVTKASVILWMFRGLGALQRPGSSMLRELTASGIDSPGIFIPAL